MKVECYGPGLEKTGLVTGSPTQFTVDTRQAGEAPLEVLIMDANYKPVDVKIKEKARGIYTCDYVPRKGLKHTIQVNYGGVATKNSPYRVYVSEPTNPDKVQVFGPGVEPGVKAHTPTHFNVDARQAGPGNESIRKAITTRLNDAFFLTGELSVTLVNDQGQTIPIEMEDNGDDTYTVGYTPTAVGPLKANVLYAGVPVPQSPIAVNVEPHIDVSKIRVDGLEPSK